MNYGFGGQLNYNCSFKNVLFINQQKLFYEFNLSFQVTMYY